MLKLEQMIVNFLHTELLRSIAVPSTARRILELNDELWLAQGRQMLPFGQHLANM
jgi:hypothetical protein